MWVTLSKGLFILIWLNNVTTSQLRSDQEILDERKSDKYFRNGDLYIKKVNEARPRAVYDFYYKRWPSNTIPFIVSENITEELKSEIAGAMKYLSKYSCLKFRPADTERDTYWIRYIFYEHEDDSVICAAEAGFTNEKDQLVLMGELCKAAVLVHELLHTAGMNHEHNRNDRDKYITIQWDNMNEDAAGQYLKDEDYCLQKGLPKQSCATENYGVSYNYESIMHYADDSGTFGGRKAYIKVNGTDAIGDFSKVGQLYGLSEGDWTILNQKYECNSVQRSQVQKPPPIPKDPPTLDHLETKSWNKTSVRPMDYNEYLKEFKVKTVNNFKFKIYY